MDRNSIEFVLGALPKERTVWHSYPDRHALFMLKHLAGESGRTISELKSSQFRSLLDKPAVKQVCARKGDGILTAADFANPWPAEHDSYYSFRLTLGTWPELENKPDRSWHQITRSGWNLVLQVNFPVSHNRKLKHRLPEKWAWPIHHQFHPVADPEREVTLGWARIDLDLEAKEALIEEVQSDWVRDAQWYGFQSRDEHWEQWRAYCEEQLQPVAKRWPDTILSAALWFLIEELGMRRIFFHTYETGSRIKRIGGTAPPRSVYTDLPKRFCFRITHNGPGFVPDSADRKLRKLFIEPETRWHVIDLDRISVRRAD